MSTFRKCPAAVADLAREILCAHETHTPLLDARLKIDFVFAYGDRDDNDKLIGDALKHHGVKALSICRNLALKDRAMGRGDAEISLDGDWWEDEATEAQQEALLDHELHHIEVRTKDGAVLTDDLQRPLLRLRPHDFQFGWFKIIAARHQLSSQECIQARAIADDAGQLFWPFLEFERRIPK